MSPLINALSYPLFQSRNDPNAWVIAFFFVGGHLRLADKLLLKSYDALPVSAIRNGALLVPGVSDTAQPTGEFWALESTREHAGRSHFHARSRTALPYKTPLNSPVVCY